MFKARLTKTLLFVVFTLVFAFVVTGIFGSVTTAQQQDITELIRKLGSQKWEERERAKNQLLNRGKDAVDPLNEALRQTTDVEIWSTGKWILSKLEAELILVPNKSTLVTNANALATKIRQLINDFDKDPRDVSPERAADSLIELGRYPGARQEVFKQICAVRINPASSVAVRMYAAKVMPAIKVWVAIKGLYYKPNKIQYVVEMTKNKNWPFTGFQIRFGAPSWGVSDFKITAQPGGWDAPVITKIGQDILITWKDSDGSDPQTNATFVVSWQGAGTAISVTGVDWEVTMNGGVIEIGENDHTLCRFG